VAVVEDDPSMRKSVERLLNMHGFVTEGYSSAEAFLSCDSASRAACVVLDIHLEGMSGLALRSRLTSSGSGLPVIFITAIDDDALESEAVQAGCVAYLHKPFSAGLLIAAVAKALADSPAD
jgi:FixJ family two-component response regulator